MPRVVWEVLTADLSLSPIYTAAQGLVCILAFTACWPLTHVDSVGRGERHLSEVPAVHQGARRQGRG